MLKPRLATLEDVEHLAPRLRKADVDELRAGSGTSPREALLEGLEHSEPAIVGADERDLPVIIFGACTIQPGLLASVWMLSSDEVYKHKRQFLRESRKWLKVYNDRWPILFNYCDSRNSAHIAWMRSLDYTFIARHERYGVEERPFYEFVRVNPIV